MENIEKFDLSDRTVKVLKNAEIHTFADLIKKTYLQLFLTYGVGPKVFKEIEELLDKYEIILKGYEQFYWKNEEKMAIYNKLNKDK